MAKSQPINPIRPNVTYFGPIDPILQIGPKFDQVRHAWPNQLHFDPNDLIWYNLTHSDPFGPIWPNKIFVIQFDKN